MFISLGLSWAMLDHQCSIRNKKPPPSSWCRMQMWHRGQGAWSSTGFHIQQLQEEGYPTPQPSYGAESYLNLLKLLTCSQLTLSWILREKCFPLPSENSWQKVYQVAFITFLISLSCSGHLHHHR